MTLAHKCLHVHPDATVSRRVTRSWSPSAGRQPPDAMQHILLTNEGESAAEVGSCQMLLHMHRGPSKLLLTHQAPVAREQKKKYNKRHFSQRKPQTIQWVLSESDQSRAHDS